MASAGRPRTTEASKRAHGTMRPDRKDPPPITHDGEKLPRMPVKLKTQAAWFWKKWARVLWDENWLSTQSTQGFILLCETYGRYEKARMHIAKYGMWQTVMTGGSLQEKKRPAWEIANVEAKNLKGMYNLFGFDPLGQRRAATAKADEKPKKPSEKEKKDIRQFVGGAGG